MKRMFSIATGSSPGSANTYCLKCTFPLLPPISNTIPQKLAQAPPPQGPLLPNQRTLNFAQTYQWNATIKLLILYCISFCATQIGKVLKIVQCSLCLLLWTVILILLHGNSSNTIIIPLVDKKQQIQSQKKSWTYVAFEKILKPRQVFLSFSFSIYKVKMLNTMLSDSNSKTKIL